MFAEAKDEAAIALVLGHELAHYLNNDCINGFIINSKIRSKLSNQNYLGLLITTSHNNKNQEHIADSTGFALANAAGYSLTSGISNFDQFKFDQDWVQSQYTWNSLKWLINGKR